MHETDVAFLDEVGDRQATVEIVTGGEHDESQVGLDESALSGVIAIGAPPRQRDLFGC